MDRTICQQAYSTALYIIVCYISFTLLAWHFKAVFAILSINMCKCSIGEIGGRLKPGEDTVMDTAVLRTDTPSIVGDGQPDAQHTAALQVSMKSTAKDNGDKEEAKLKVHALQHNLESDFGRDQSSEPETLVDEEDSTLTLTQSLSSVTALTLTLTEISQMDPSQSPGKVATYRDRLHVEGATGLHTVCDGTAGDGSKGEGGEAGDDGDDGEGGEAGEDGNASEGGDNGEGEDVCDAGGSGEGNDAAEGGYAREGRGAGEDGAKDKTLKLSKTLPDVTESVDAAERAGDKNTGMDPSVNIGDIVRSEMRKILEVRNNINTQ